MNLNGVIGVGEPVATSFMGVWLRQSGGSPAMAAYSFLTVGEVLLLAGAFVMMVATPMRGLAERLLIAAGLQWKFLAALWMSSRSSRAVWNRA